MRLSSPTSRRVPYHYHEPSLFSTVDRKKMKETALVTGAAGFVGWHMVNLLLKKGYRVLATDKPECRVDISHESLEYIPADLRKPETLTWISERGIDRVFHIAGVHDFVASWQELYSVNCIGTENLLQLLLPSKENIKSIIICGSGSVYGRNFRTNRPTRESEEAAPTNLYEKSKLIEEKIALRYSEKHGLPLCVIRPSAIYGPRSRYALAVSIFMINKGILKFIPGSGKNIVTLVHVEDVVRAAEFLSSKPGAIGQVFNIADDSPTNVKELLKHVATLLGKRIYPVHIPMTLILTVAQIDEFISEMKGRRPTLERDLTRYLAQDAWMDNAKLKSLGYRFKYSDVRIGIEETVDWYRSEGWL